MDRATADWLLAAFTCGRPKTALAIAREIVREAQVVDEALLTFAYGRNHNLSRAMSPHFE